MNPDESLHEQRIRERAYRLWEEGGRISGHDLEYWERARELIAIEDNAGAGLLPNPASESTRPGLPAGVEEAEIQENYREFPGRTDQGEKRPSPEPPHARRARRKPK